MATPMQYELLMAQKACRCGGKLIFDGQFYACSECNQLYCPECLGYVVASGGCFTCMNCGFGLCE